MAAKLLHSLADDNPDLQKQIGCMNGILQIFDRRHIGRRFNGQSHKGLLPPGNSQFSNASLDADSNTDNSQDSMERIGNKDTSDKQVHIESSKVSLSSSFPTSFSSLDCGKLGHRDPSSMDRIIVPENPAKDMAHTQPIASPKHGRLSVDLRDVVKESMHRESRGLSVQTKMVGGSHQVSKHKGSPRLLQQSKSFNGSLGVGISGKNDLPGDLKESLKLLAKLREAPWYETKDSYSLSTPRDVPRYSYDGKMNHLPSESQDFSNSDQKIKDLPRLSLDSQESSMRASGYDLENGDDWYNKRPSCAQNISRPSSVVAKLMGLETFPDEKMSRDSQLGPTTVASLEDHGCSMHSKMSDVCRPIGLPSSPRSSRKDPGSPRWKHGDMRPLSSAKCPIEPAPWKYIEGGRSPQKQVLQRLKSPERLSSNSSPSAYREVEKRLKDLEFEQSGKDLRALKQILEAMEAKGLLGTTAKEDQHSVLQTKRKDEKSYRISNKNSGYISASESHRKGAGISGHGKYSPNQRATKNQTSKASSRNNVAKTSTDSVSRNRSLRVGQTSTKAQPVSIDGKVSSIKNSGSSSPRLQKKLELDRRSIPPTPDSGKSRRQSNRQVTESGGSPGGRRRVKSSIVPQNDDHPTKVDMEAPFNEISTGTSQCQVPQAEALKCSDISEIRTKSSNRSSEGDKVEELPAFGPEHPSPVSVLDAPAYGEDPLSPVKQTLHKFEGIGAKTSESYHVDREWDSVDKLSTNHDVGSGFTSEINCKNSGDVDTMVEKLTQQNFNPNEAKDSNPVHKYVCEILSASGLLLSDLNSTFSTFQLHQSDQLINPELFFVLEQTKLRSKSDKLHRKLIFDAVNENLALKLASARHTAEPWLSSWKLAKRTLNPQKLLREVCEEIEQVNERREFRLLGEEGDGVKSILWEDLLCRSDPWTEFCDDESAIVLDIERLIFRDLVHDVVMGLLDGSRAKPRKQRRRRLFLK